MSPQAPFLAPERDSAFKPGRPKTGSTPYYTIPGCSFRAAASTVITQDFDTYSPWFTDTPIVVDQLATEVATLFNGGNFRMGFYAADADWQPLGAPLADSGSILTTTTGVKTYTPASPIYVPRGRYLSVVNQDNATAAFRTFLQLSPIAIGTAIGTTPYQTDYRVSRAYAAFPTPGTAWTTTSNNSTSGWHYFAYRVLNP